jgi:hypothetical protein
MTIQKSSKAFIIGCKMKNSQNIGNSECINILDDSDVQILNSKFQNCKLVAMRCLKSFLNISSSSFTEIGAHYLYLDNNSSLLIENMNFPNIAIKNSVIRMTSSQGMFLDCHFSFSDGISIYSTNGKEILIERCKFDGMNYDRINHRFFRVKVFS